MAAIAAKDVKALRDATGAGILDARKALEQTNGDFEAATQWLRERGLGRAAERADRENNEGSVAVAFDASANTLALVELKCETDFVAKSPQFVALADKLAQAVASDGESAVRAETAAVDDLKVTLKENIEVGQVVRFEVAAGHVADSYLHKQNGRGVNGVLVELEGGDAELAHEVAVHIAFGRPKYVRRDEVPAEEVEQERATLEAATRNEGKPEAALPKIVEGRLTGWYKRAPGGVLIEQPFARDEKITVGQLLGSAQVVRFAQVVVGE